MPTDEGREVGVVDSIPVDVWHSMKGRLAKVVPDVLPV